MIFSERSGVADSIYGNCQAPIKMLIETRGEEYEKNSQLSSLFNMGTSENYGDILSSLTGMNGFEPVGENGAHPKDAMEEGYKKLIVYETWKDSFAISREMIDDSKTIDMKKQPEGFTRGYYRTREMFGAALYGAAISGASTALYKGKSFDATTADGLTLFNTAHPAKVSGATQSNCYSDTFSADALGELESKMQNFRGDNGDILDVAPNTIVIPNVATLKKAVFAAIGADKEPTTANNAFNYQFGRWNVIIWNYLNQFVSGDVSPWILIDKEYNDLYGGAVWNDRVPLEVTSDIDRDTDANRWFGYARFGAVFNDWRFAAIGGISGGSSL